VWKFLVEDDFAEMAKKAVFVLTNPGFAEKIAERARKLVEKNFSWEIIAQQLDRIYTDTVKMSR